ncbi:MAG: enolase C-terminal domain-like protein [Actinomycetota bacterium]
MSELRRVAFRVKMRIEVLGVSVREGEFVQGPAGWGEYSPLPSWGPEDRALARSAAIEAATEAFPEPMRNRVEVNAMVPRVKPEEAVRIALGSGCRTVKVKVGDRDGLDRVAAVRDALGARGRIRLDANGAWDVETAVSELQRFHRYEIELCEDPCSARDQIAEVRRRSRVPIAIEAPIRSVADARDLQDVADALVVKPQRIGGARAALRAAEASKIATIASSALETSVGLAMVAAVAAALPESPFAHGIGTAGLLLDDPVDHPLAPLGGKLVPRRVEPKEA